MRDFNCCTLTIFDVLLCVRLNNSVALLITLFQVFFVLLSFNSICFLLLFVFPLLLSMHKHTFSTVINIHNCICVVVTIQNIFHFSNYATMMWSHKMSCLIFTFFCLSVCTVHGDRCTFSAKYAKPLFGSYPLAPSRLWPFRKQQNAQANHSTTKTVCTSAQAITHKEHNCMQFSKTFIRCGCSETSSKTLFARLSAHNWPTFT